MVIYDAFRPQKAVNHFARWSESSEINEDMKEYFFPYVDHDKAFDLGYIAKKSGHSRGSTIDVSIIKHDDKLHEIEYVTRILNDGREFTFINDNTVDMGSHFDLFDEASWSLSTLVPEEAQINRKLLIDTMAEVGFVNYDKEWWHFTLENEPFIDTYFDFEISKSTIGI